MPSPPPLRRLQAHAPADLLSTSTEELTISSPPYRLIASTSNLHEELQSPAYYAPVKVPDMSNEKKATVTDELESPLSDLDTTKSRPTVHYVDGQNRTIPPAPGYTRTDSADALSSRASSIATDDEDSEDYDWSGEEDLVDEEAKFEERMGIKAKRKGWGIKRLITLLFSTIIGSTFIAGILVVPGVLVQIYWYKPNPTDYRRYVKDNVQAWLFWAAANLVISWYLAMIVDIIPVFARFFIAAFWGHVSEHVKTRIEMYDSIKNNIKPLLYAASGWASWIIIFGHIYDLYNTQDPSESRAPYTQRVQDVVAFLFFFALMIYIKKMLSHIIGGHASQIPRPQTLIWLPAFFFHRTAYKDRVEAVQEALTTIEALRQYRPKVSSRARKSGMRTTLSDSEHYRSLSSALNSASTPGSQSKLRQYNDAEDWTDADSEDPDRTLVGKDSFFGWKGKEKKKVRLSWLPMSGGGSDDKHASELADLNKSEHEMEALPLNSRSNTPISSFHEDRGSPHRYPPTSANNGSTEEGGGTEVTLAQAAKVFKNAVLHDARNIKGKNVGDGSMAWNVGSTQEAKRLARSIYTRFKDRRRTYLLPSDFYPAFPSEAEGEAAFRVFDKDNNGDISRVEIKSTLVKVYKERRFLSRSMRDVGAALKTLDIILLVFAMIILFFIGISVFGVKVGDSLTSVYTIGIAMSFIFKNSASSAFDAIMFLFVSHPYDTGDRCFIDTEVLVVKKVGLFATVFTRSDGTETYYFNSQLFTKFITNVRRSGKMFENVTLQVAWRTPLEKLDMLEKLMNEWLSTEENRWYDPSTSVNTTGAYDQNLADWDLRWKRKTAFHAAVRHYCHQLDITCFESTIPIVYADPSTKQYTPPEPSSPNNAAIVEETRSPLNVGEDPNVKAMKPILGFQPPLSTRVAHLTRARKSRSKKTSMRGMDAG
ncbi:hypothetical protein D9615_000037 [Tricholomella constricta]|uniref:EF-hand domain-containing protein n=1 Tax=Tricholomella constricta TaxID=117010 RepID=A0A8H5HRW6_9AGAR|nr:hypothetical protein D9615_000037 [Tricholomella constricta]